MLFTPEQFLLLGVVLLGGLLIGYACAPSPRKWKRRVREQSDSFTDHYAALEEQLRAAKQQVADLESQAKGLRHDQIEAERTIRSLRAAAMAAPAVAVAAESVHRPALALVEPEPGPVTAPEPVAEAEWTPVVGEPDTVTAHASTPQTLAEPRHLATEAGATVEPSAEIEHHASVVEAAVVPVATRVAEEVSDETPKGAPAPGDTFPAAENAAAPREAAAPLPADSAPPPEAVLTEPVIEHVETHPAPVAVDAFPEPVIVAPMTPVATDAPPAPIGPAEPEMPSKGWFASSARDDLTRIRGIDGPLNTRLFSLGVVRFEDLEKLSAEDEMALEQRLALPVGYIAREQWRTQSALLRAGQTEEHAAHFVEPVAVG